MYNRPLDENGNSLEYFTVLESTVSETLEDGSFPCVRANPQASWTRTNMCLASFIARSSLSKRQGIACFALVYSPAVGSRWKLRNNLVSSAITNAAAFLAIARCFERNCILDRSFSEVHTPSYDCHELLFPLYLLLFGPGASSCFGLYSISSI